MRFGPLRSALPWGKGVSLLGSNVEASLNWFGKGLSRLVQDGRKTSFWVDIWLGHTPRWFRFPKFFQVFEQQIECIGSMQDLRGVVWELDLRWRRPLCAWEHEVVHELFALFERGGIYRMDWILVLEGEVRVS